MSSGIIEASRAASAADGDAAGISRRRFLQAGFTLGAAAGGGLLLGFAVPASGGATRPSVIGGDAPDQAPAGLFAPNAFVRVDRSGQVTLVMPKVEMGQGVYTSIPMLIAEELEVPLDSVVLDHAPADAKHYGDPLLGGGQLTGGSTSIRYAWDPMRRAGATARTLLVAAAAQQWKVDPASCSAANGEVLHAPSGRRAGYGSLVDAAAKLPVPANVALKQPEAFTLIGKPVKRLDSPEKVDGTAQFGLDVRLPGMLYAAIVNSPVFGGTVASVDDSAAKRVPGVRQVVRVDNAVAVVGDHTWAAKRGAAALVITWHEGDGARVSMDDIVGDLARASERPGAVARNDGDVAKAFGSAGARIDSVYQQPFLAHATMEPVNCTVHVRGDGCEIWVGTQVPGFAVDAAKRVTGFDESRIVLHNHLLGGGFGRRLETDMIAQALKVGKQVDAPVKVVWTREEDIRHDMYRPYYYDRISAGVDANGKPVAWQHRIVGSSIMARFAPGAVKNDVDSDAVEVAADLPYEIPNQRVEYVRQEPRHVPTAFWRGVGPTRSAFVVESFIDELAVHAKADPVAYRRSLLGRTPRARNVLDVVARESGWGQAVPAGHGRGVSVLHAFGSFFSMIVDVAVADGEVSVERVVCAVDCGMVVNPDTVEAQIQGGIVFGITAALYGEITIRDGRVEQSNFTDYRMLRINQTPKIDVHIVKSTEAPGGIGEPGTSAIAAAVANAIHAATGKRLYRLPVGDQLKTA
ncbi:xanthine dehydrogenase family protein molybdopterin-binding subunit [Burkholderia plantarii]|uniref:Isoquinoline 1-oxidoreductase subunit beta n=1 Tax=Burkholderia plantarii TaxID=41899 RepID=A0A0B6S574_BURPL|nr:xanthine dehydrogenase family protein molybdopterin-binding subunit [Burkholderia plantarii]AJK48460.1 isoquinoline 1-oxidoreductase subunit beta [Burkholderia plantarii]